MNQSHHLSYQNRLERLGLTDLKTRGERVDFIPIYKIVHGLEKVNWCNENKILKPERNIKCRRHQFQLSRERTSRNEPRTHFLFKIMATPWNNLPKNLHSFKSKLDLYLNEVGRNTLIYS